MDDEPFSIVTPAPLPSFTIGTRGSPLALAQAEETKARLLSAWGGPPALYPLSIIRTTGDAIQDRALLEVGGKGLFTRELDQALLEGRIDLAVHSAKDLPTALPDGIVIAGYLPREDARDALISNLASSIEGLPAGTVLGTASLRRQAQAKRLRPDLEVTLLRGNVGTRLARIEEGRAGATILALAGLKRLGLENKAAAILDPQDFLPAIGQGAIALVIRLDDERAHAAIAAIADTEAGTALAAERAFLSVLDGSCRTPIAGHAVLKQGLIHFRGSVLRPDGSEAYDVAGTALPEDAARLGTETGLELRAKLPDGFFAVL